MVHFHFRTTRSYWQLQQTTNASIAYIHLNKYVHLFHNEPFVWTAVRLGRVQQDRAGRIDQLTVIQLVCNTRSTFLTFVQHKLAWRLVHIVSYNKERMHWSSIGPRPKIDVERVFAWRLVHIVSYNKERMRWSSLGPRPKIDVERVFKILLRSPGGCNSIGELLHSCIQPRTCCVYRL